MRKIVLLLCVAALGSSMVGCAYIPGGTNLGKVSKDVGFKNVTTGDGTFENYTAVGHYTGTEIGIAVGIFGIKFFELFPMQSNEELLKEIANSAKKDGADAMINVTPHSGWFMPVILPFIGIGIYVDHTEGTGIKTR